MTRHYTKEQLRRIVRATYGRAHRPANWRLAHHRPVVATPIPNRRLWRRPKPLADAAGNDDLFVRLVPFLAPLVLAGLLGAISWILDFWWGVSWPPPLP